MHFNIASQVDKIKIYQQLLFFFKYVELRNSVSWNPIAAKDWTAALGEPLLEQSSVLSIIPSALPPPISNHHYSSTTYSSSSTTKIMTIKDSTGLTVLEERKPKKKKKKKIVSNELIAKRAIDIVLMY